MDRWKTIFTPFGGGGEIKHNTYIHTFDHPISDMDTNTNDPPKPKVPRFGVNPTTTTIG